MTIYGNNMILHTSKDKEVLGPHTRTYLKHLSELKKYLPESETPIILEEYITRVIRLI